MCIYTLTYIHIYIYVDLHTYTHKNQQKPTQGWSSYKLGYLLSDNKKFLKNSMLYFYFLESFHIYAIMILYNPPS